MNETLYRKYRPKNFSEIVGQKHIVQTFENAIKNDRIGHAYLFTGPRGTGKTSIARILSKAINCEKSKDFISCDKCPSCQAIAEGKSLDIIEIDAASNTGVDNIRELRETVALPPTLLKYKIYIIDEVHMLSTGAFNALLKTLEEPPRHAIFILATTEIHKVPATIISRCQRFDFSRLPLSNIIEKLTLVAKSEKVKIDQESLEMIAIASEGGMRDAESLLGQIISLEDKNITSKEVEQILGTADRKFSQALTKMIILDDSTGAIAKINELSENGYDLQVFTKSLINYLRQLMLLKVSPELKSFFTYELTNEQLKELQELAQKTNLLKIVNAINFFLEAQNKISAFILPQLPLEIAIIKATGKMPAKIDTPNQPAIESAPNPIIKQQDPISSTPAPVIETPEPARNATQGDAGGEKVSPIETYPANEELPASPIQNEKEIGSSEVKQSWPKLLKGIEPFNHSLKALLSNCQIVNVKGSVITIATPYDFYKEKLSDPANQLTIEQVLGKILGLKITLKAVTNQEAGIKNIPSSQDQEEANNSTQNELLDSAIEIIGGTVVNE